MIKSELSQVQTVSQFSKNIRHLLESEFRFVHISGEISSVKTPYSGHSYFVLKDDSSQLRCVLFRGQKKFLDSPLKDGQKVICHGRITLYEPRGDYQLIVDTVDSDGKGLLQKQFQQLKDRLHKKGYFDEKRKKTLPENIQNIAVITSPSGAAIHDFLKLHSERSAQCNILVVPVKVQGEKSAEQIASAIKLVNRQNLSDVIVLCRGGGSMDDLWAFNEEIVANAIFTSKLPVISAIGHEIDFTIADFCADRRCATPTSAAELLCPDAIQQLRLLKKYKQILYRQAKRQIHESSTLLASLVLSLKYFSSRIDSDSYKADLASEKLYTSMGSILQKKRSYLETVKSDFYISAPASKLAMNDMQLQNLQKRLRYAIDNILSHKSERISNSGNLLDSYSPLATLSRGYSIVFKGGSTQDPVLTDCSRITKGDSVSVLLKKGKLYCSVIDIKKS